MSKWDSFFGGTPKQSDGKSTEDSNGTDRVFPYGQKPTELDTSNATSKAKMKIIQTLSICDRLPKRPTFSIGGQAVDVEEGVIGAMGTTAAELLDLAQQPSLAPGLGMGGSSSSEAEEELD